MAARRRKAKADPKKVIGYIRVSTDEQALGPEAQKEALRTWCEAHDARLCAVYEDIGVSGGTPVEKRPGLNLALDAVAEHGAGAEYGDGTFLPNPTPTRQALLAPLVHFPIDELTTEERYASGEQHPP